MRESATHVCVARLPRPLIIGLALAACMFLSGCDKAKGVAAVKELCARDGGKRIYETTYVSGYLTWDHEDFCASCIETLVDGNFEHVDVLVKRRGADQYLRYTLGRSGDADCESWSGRADLSQRLVQLGIGGGQCVVVTPLADAPKGFAIRFKEERITMPDISPIRMTEWAVVEMDSGRVFATVRDYRFASRVTALLDMSGGDGMGDPDATCLSTEEHVESVLSLKDYVLRDPSKHETSTTTSGGAD